MKKILKNLIVRDWPIKAVCILAAAFLWVYVASGQSTIGKFPSKIPIKTNNVQAGLTAIYEDKEVELQIMAEPAVWNKLSADSFSASADLSGLKEGTYELSVGVVSTVEGVKIVRRTPEKILVSLEPVTKKTVTIGRRVQGNAAEGMVAGTVSFNPAEVEVSGPRSVVNSISEAVAVINLNGESADFEKTINLSAYNEKNEEISGVIFNPMEVRASVQIVKAGNGKTVGVRVKTSGAPVDGFYISKIVVSPITFNVTGAESALSSVNYLETQSIDISGLDGTTERFTTVQVPDGVALDKGQVNRVKVTIVATENSSSKQLNLSVNPINLGGLNLVSYTPTEIKAVVSGPKSIIDNLTSSDVVLMLDFSGRFAGTAVLNISRDLVKLPAQVSLDSIVPSSISVVLADK